MKIKAYNDFYKKLRHLSRRRKTGLLLAESARTAGTILLSLSIYTIADYFLAFPSEALIFLDALLIIWLSALLVARALKIIFISKAESAAFLDSAAEDKRRSIQNAYELEKHIVNTTGDESFEKYLITKTAEDANKVMNGLKLKDIMPSAVLKKRSRYFLMAFAAFAVIIFAKPGASLLILERIFSPLKDIPPYSIYRFTINPPEAKVIYGDTLEISARIEGGPVKSQVWFCTRESGKIKRIACFREEGNRFTQKMEKVTSPLEFCFATGKARSRWQKVKVLFQPKVLLAKISITPPGYTKLPGRSFMAGAEDVKGLKNSDVELMLASNRPLAGGILRVKPENGEGQSTISGEKNSKNSIVFRWKLKSAAKLKADMIDLIGTKSNQPLKLKQSVVEDLPPEITISEPGPFTMATPGVKIAFRGTAGDDIGLRKIELVKALYGYHDRINLLNNPGREKNVDIDFELDLAKAGVAPGQTLEFYLEAFDVNPELTGVAASDILRIQIISETEYAEWLRAQIQTESITAYYRELSYALAELKKITDEFSKALEKGGLSEEEKKNFIDKIRENNEKAEKIFRKFAEDFPIYDMEKEHKKIFKEILSSLVANDEIIAGMNPTDDNDLKKRLAQIGNGLASKKDGMDKANDAANKFEALAKIMAAGALFKKLTMEQSSIVRMLERYDTGHQQERSAMLGKISAQQKEVQEKLVKLTEELRTNAEKLQIEFKDLKEDSIRFAAAVNRLKIPEYMGDTVTNAEKQRGQAAYKNALEAYKKMLILLGKNNESKSFCDMMNGKISFDAGESLRCTAKEMLDAINKQINGSGNNPGGQPQTGMGFGGQSGYSTSSYSPLNVPLLGPQRSTADQKKQGKSGSGGESCKTCDTNGKIKKNATEKLNMIRKEKTDADTLSVDEVPEKYRNAVKQYFGEE